jgi:2-polyprenyl-6-methoxyphenol hydroxylase-like FAD-dependent oxidoreductase
MSQASVEETDVVVVGLGPAGLLASLLLGQKGYKVIAFDRWPTPYPLPRAVTFDHEIARILASIGINADNDPSIDYHDDHYLWLNKDDKTLLEVDWKSTANDGWRNRYWFSQPELEERLRGILSSLPNVDMRQGFEIFNFEQDESGVTVGYKEVHVEGFLTVPTPGGKEGSVKAKFAIGSDGANSFLRRSVGFEFTDLEFYYDWTVVDVKPKELPKYKTAHFQICDPKRPTTVVPGGPGRRRWEFMVLPGEDPQEIAKEETAWKLLADWGMTPENAELERSVAWRFQGKYLENWRAGRTLLVGDAAHLMPPFAGEGMCAAFRDVFNLVWRLDLVLQSKAGDALLDEWSSERREQAKWYINFSVNLGRIICVTDPAEAAERDAKMISEYVPGQTADPHAAVLGEGTWDARNELAGKPSFQGNVAYKGRTGRFDDAVGRGWFLVTSVDKAGEKLTDAQLTSFTKVGGQVVTVGPRGSGANIVDIDGTYAKWFSENNVNHLVLRPDYYVAATANSEAALRSSFDSVLKNVLAA